MKEIFNVPEYGTLTYEKKAFECECFQNKTIEIFKWDIVPGKMCDLVGHLKKAEGMKKGDLLYVRIECNNAQKAKEVGAAGFRYMETSIEPYILTAHWDQERFSNYVFETVRANDEMIKDVMETGKNSLKNLRFSRDETIGDELSSYRYMKWLSNLYESGADIELLVIDQEIAGFMTVQFGDDHSAIWNLGGIKAGRQGSGYGIKLYASVLAYCKNTGAKAVRTGISVGNVPVLNLYSKLGFKFENPTIVMHHNVGVEL